LYPSLENSTTPIAIMDVVEAVEVIKAAEALRSGKILLRTLESSRYLNSALFRCFEKY
jgi:hypothetical protein